MEKKRNQKSLSKKNPHLIGIGGIGHSVGCTHFAIMMANFLAGYQRKRTALLEWNQSGDFERLEKVCTGTCRNGKAFRVLEVDYFKGAGRQELTEVLSSNYDEVLIDLGVVNDEDLAELMRCEQRFLVASFSEWQESALLEFWRAHGAGNKSWEYLAVFGSEETRREFRRRPGIVSRRIPFSADAFSVTKECCSFFQKLLNT